MPKPNLVFVGAPGSGKGTQIQILQKEGYTKLSTGDMLRDEAKSGSKLGQTVGELMRQGALVPDDLVRDILESALASLQESGHDGIIFDGYPRNVEQAASLEKTLMRINSKSAGKQPIRLDAVLEIVTPDALILERIMHRYICSKCGASYNSAKGGNKPKVEGVCDVCGCTKFTTREDDKEEVVKARLANYHKTIAPLLTFYKPVHYVVDAKEGNVQITEKRLNTILGSVGKGLASSSL